MIKWEQTGVQSMSHKLFPTRPTQAQVMKVLKKELAQKGYHIFGVAKRHQKTQSDFLAVKSDNAGHFLLARPGRPSVVLQPYFLVSNMIPAREVVKKMQFEGRPLVKWLGMIDLRRHNFRVEHFVPPDQQAELRALLPRHQLIA